ncbi:Non-imprinted in Prader-Willi/Angelman syndrome region protein 2 [Gongronella butleri]|nr:Non-imprinted in Prader-Willi/Angelman syndrome region protein 2 [Gongronella butleri]
MESKYIGLILAICSSILIGISFVITKMALQRCTPIQEGVYASDSHRYLRNPIWWVGMVTMICGELLNFVGYIFAPAVLITPLGALSVVWAVLASPLLKEKITRVGLIGCLLSLLGAVIIVLHSPEDPPVQSVEELVAYMLQPGFIVYFVFAVLIVVLLIWKAAPRWGKDRPLVYVTICSLVGSLSIMTIKAFGIAVRLTIEGNNQFTQPSTYIFAFMCIIFILIQINYFNKALDTYSTNVVTPLYYVFFTTATILASAIMFQGWHTSDAITTVTLICGFLIIFLGVYLLNSLALASTLKKEASHASLTCQDVPMQEKYRPGSLSRKDIGYAATSRTSDAMTLRQRAASMP